MGEESRGFKKRERGREGEVRERPEKRKMFTVRLKVLYLFKTYAYIALV